LYVTLIGMSSSPPKSEPDKTTEGAPKKRGKGKLVLLAVPVVLLLVVAGLWFS
jgi:hypothetical protein